MHPARLLGEEYLCLRSSDGSRKAVNTALPKAHVKESLTLEEGNSSCTIKYQS